jgi:hypothetical protein
MTQALGLLLRLQLRGWGRYLGRGLGTVRGLITAVVGLMVFVPWLLTLVFNPTNAGIDSSALGRFGPGGLLAYCLLNVIFSSSDRAIYFTPAEIQFLFAGPFTRRQVLAYKISLTLLVSVPAMLFMMLVIRVKGAFWPYVLLGTCLLSIFMQLFTLVLGLLGSALGTDLFSRGRRLIGTAAVALLAAAAYQTARTVGSWQPRALAAHLFDTPAWHIVTWPMRSFFDVMQAKSLWPDLLPALGVALATNLSLLGLIFALDAHFLEASAAASARMYARLQRLRGRAVAVEGGPPVPATRSKLGLPMMPYWGGIGPILWRQMTTALRSMGRLLLVLFIIGLAGAVPLIAMFLEEGQKALEVFVPTLIGVVSWLTIFLTALVPFDYRGDIDRIAALKSLPVAPWRLTVGQLLTPVLLLSLMQLMAVAVGVMLAPDQTIVALIIALYVVPFNFLLIGIENLLFLLFPVRLLATTPGDFQAVGRNVLLSLGKVFGLMVVGGVAVVVAVLVGWLTGNKWVGALSGLPVVVGAGVALVPLIGLAFRWFDVGRDTPA